MSQHLTLDKIDYWEESILVGEKKHFLANTCFQTDQSSTANQLTAEEEEVVATLLDSFQHSVSSRTTFHF